MKPLSITEPAQHVRFGWPIADIVHFTNSFTYLLTYSNSRPLHCQVTTLGKLSTHIQHRSDFNQTTYQTPPTIHGSKGTDTLNQQATENTVP